MLDLGQKVRKLRESRDWSQAEFARRAGVTKSAISTYELGIRTPSADIVCAFAKVFSVSADNPPGIAERRVIESEGLSERDKAPVRELAASLKEK
ncbi:MAG: helix-turn-helix transcriptional regulator [Oscillibacter sp.]|nr:helix-turn-helix transcriptional regulator [Oscillibacter sp.]